MDKLVVLIKHKRAALTGAALAIVLISIIIMGALIGGCSSDSVSPSPSVIPSPEATPLKVTENNEPTSTPSITSTPEVLDGKVRSRLTGTWVSEEAGLRRPYAIMLNNIRIANPHSGISQASILYECLVEGGITRLMGIFEEFDTDRIGSVRSARHYYVSIADEYDAIFTHFGQTKYATAKMKELKIDNLSGLEGVGATVFYRDSKIKAPHNAFASFDGIIKGTEKKKYRTTLRENLSSHYDFYPEDTSLESDKVVQKISLKFSNSKNSSRPYFVYDSDKKEYARFQFEGKHIDINTNEQLYFKNIIVQYVKEWNIDKNGYQDMDLKDASGEGLYITNGKAVEITWEKNEAKKTMTYYDVEGNKLAVNEGKTYIALFNRDHKENVIME